MSIIAANPSPLFASACLVVLAAALAGCRGGTGAAPSPGVAATSSPLSPATAEDVRPVVLFLGTSLTAGLGLDPQEAYPALIQRKIDEAGLRYLVVNAGVSGETSAGARQRIDWLLRREVAVLVIETGANDGLRGQEPEATRDNIQAICDRARTQSPPPKLVLAAMEALPNYGADYRRRFRAIYAELARSCGAVLVPFLLDGVAGHPELNQADGVHPTGEGQRRVAENVWKALGPVLEARDAQERRTLAKPSGPQ